MTDESDSYNGDTMAGAGGRPPTKDAPPFGRRLAVLRRGKGLSQRELGARLGVPRETVDYYERRALNPTLDVIERVAEALEVSPAQLIGDDAAPLKVSRKAGPTGKVQKVFEDVSRLPRRQQEKIVEFVSAFVAQYEQSRQ
ncbi:MAG: helix-turn-helix domain-containing protein [Acidobacteriota bacterium]|nr:helix-turn-helix domain-containing protein [Acidobacteriota bacterium]